MVAGAILTSNVNVNATGNTFVGNMALANYTADDSIAASHRGNAGG
jgi:hypothetical protein